MNNQEKLAREWAERAKNFEVSSHEQQAAAKFILAHTTPSTMAGVEWVHADHHMAGAYWEGDIPVVMIDPVDGGKTTVMTVEEESTHEADDSDLTPNGKRYKLVEAGATVSQDENVTDDQRDHPEVLVSVFDFRDAPVGTVVEQDHTYIWQKQDEDLWESIDAIYGDVDMACAEGPCRVLRWGDEA